MLTDVRADLRASRIGFTSAPPGADWTRFQKNLIFPPLNEVANPLRREEKTRFLIKTCFPAWTLDLLAETLPRTTRAHYRPGMLISRSVWRDADERLRLAPE